MHGTFFRLLLILFVAKASFASTLNVDMAAYRKGAIHVSQQADQLEVTWTDEDHHAWQAVFSLDSTRPLIHSVSSDGKAIVTDAKPIFRCVVGKRKGGWDVFFDDPAEDPGGYRHFVGDFQPQSVTVRSVGNRVKVSFSGMRMGIFSGILRYDFYPGTALIQQVAVLKTDEPDVAYYYDAGIDISAGADRTPGVNMASQINYYDAQGLPQAITPPYGSERHTAQVHYRAIAARSGAGSLAVFPAPHRYFFARDYSTNLGYTWFSSWRGRVSLGIQQQPDDNTAIYPWMNAPPGTEQEMGVFLLPNAGAPSAALDAAKSFTHEDRFPHLPGYVTFAPHWHFADTVQAIANGPDWVPPFKTVLEHQGIDSAMIMDFHIDGHPGALTEVRLQELSDYYRVSRVQSDTHFLVIPSEEADVYLGGHWGLVFPRPVMWFEDRKPDQPFMTVDSKFGTVYRVSTPEEMWAMVTAEHGIAYETHPRTKGSTGFPDKILDQPYFRSDRYIGVGWKAMPSDLSSPRLGERAFKVLDDLSNLGLHKVLIGEDDLFQISSTDELYAHLNANYLRMARLPDFDHYIDILTSVSKADGFISTGEVLLPEVAFHPSTDAVRFSATVDSTFPLRFAEIVWGDGKETHHEIFPLESSAPFDHHQYEWSAKAPGWIWARLAVWDIAADGGFTSPRWKTIR